MAQGTAPEQCMVTVTIFLIHYRELWAAGERGKEQTLLSLLEW